jgi:metal-dependent HD superfamily phosphatase/phosphodiesterase
LFSQTFLHGLVKIVEVYWFEYVSVGPKVNRINRIFQFHVCRDHNVFPGRVSAFEAGKIDIHSVSALSIQNVEIIEGGDRPITVKVTMSDSAGIFQIDQLLKPRIENSGLHNLIHVIAEVTGGKEACIIDRFEV